MQTNLATKKFKTIQCDGHGKTPDMAVNDFLEQHPTARIVNACCGFTDNATILSHAVYIEYEG